MKILFEFVEETFSMTIVSVVEAEMLTNMLRAVNETLDNPKQ